MQRYIFDTKDSFVYYLWYILRLAYMEIDRHGCYLRQLEEVIKERDLRGNGKPVPTNVFNEIRDKIEYVSMGICNLLGDHADKAISYKKFRHEADKRNTELKLDLSPLDDNCIQQLNNLNTNRNWALHIPESLMTAELDIRKKIIETGKYEQVLNPIEVGYELYHDKAYMIELYDNNVMCRSIYRELFRQMRKDYAELLGEKIEIKWSEHNIRTAESMLPINLSAQIQIKKYKGVDDETMNEVLRKLNEKL